ncbi:MAG: hypothetical protein PHO69_03125 [Petrimonas sp.]|nr:hypothetical protein [Petrimonas sp.]
MLVKIIRNGVESEWFPLTKKMHRALLRDKPEAAIFRIEDVYPDSPESGQLITLEFSYFTVITRDFVLEENRQEKQKERHHDKRPMDVIEQSGNSALITSVEEDFLRNELKKTLYSAMGILTETQERRVRLFVEDGLSFAEIGRREGVTHRAAEYSVQAGIKKIKKYLSGYFQNGGFLSD